MRKLLALVGAVVVASSLAASPALSDSPSPTGVVGTTEKVQTFTVDGVAVPVPVRDGTVVRDIVVPNTDGSTTPKVYIPKGFSAAAIPADLNKAANDINNAPPGGGVAVSSHTEHWAHTYAYSWGGLVQEPGRRSTWLYDRTNPGEEGWVYGMAHEINGGLRPAMETEQGIPWDWSPAHSYYDDDANDGACQKGGYSFQGYSFSVICTSFNILASCDNANFLGCAWVVPGNATVHNGHFHQPSMFVKAGLSDPYLRRNVTWHEIGHSLGWGHNSGEADSIVHANQPDWKFNRITYHDTWDLSNKYRHQPNS